MEDNDTPIYEILFSMEVKLCECFTGLTPLNLRREKAREVFLLIKRYNIYAANEMKKKNKKKVIRRQAGDDWF